MSVNQQFDRGEFITNDTSTQEAWVSPEVPDNQTVRYEFKVTGRAAGTKTASWTFVGVVRRDNGGSLADVPLSTLDLDVIKQVNLTSILLGWAVDVVYRSDKKIALTVKGGAYDVRWMIDGDVQGVKNP